MSSDADGHDLLSHAAMRVARGPFPGIAGLVTAWRKAFPEQEPTAALACRSGAVTELSLCLRPREGRWLADVVEISRAVGIDPDLLTGFLRTCEAIERLGDAHPVGEESSGRLLAARDRDEDA